MATRFPPANTTTNNNNKKKKLTIRINSKPALPTAYLDASWTSLEQALRAIRSRQPALLSEQELYSKVEDLCYHGLGGETYALLYRNVDAFLSGELASVGDQSLAMQTPQFLELFARAWHNYSEQMKATRLIFTVLDRQAKSLTQTEVPSSRSLWEMGMHLYRAHLERNGALLDKLVGGILEVLQQERVSHAFSVGGEAAHFSAHHELLRMLSNLGLYAVRFEARFLQDMTDFYAAEGVELMRVLNVPDYLVAAENRIDEETRSAMHLDPSSRKPMQRCVEQSLLAAHAGALIDKGLDALLDDNEHRMEDLARMYRLLGLVNAHTTLLLKAFHAHTKARGLTLVMDDENQDFVGSMVVFKAKVDRTLAEAFRGDAMFQKSARDAFETFLNSRDNRPAELIAKHMDRALRATQTADSETTLNKTMELFRFLHAKDVFEGFYKNCLAKRLLLGTSSSNELEKMMIKTLKAECGSAFTNKLEGMFRDVDMSKTLMNDWTRVRTANAALAMMEVVTVADETGGGATSMATTASAEEGEEQSLPLEPVVHVLSTGFWPTFPDCNIRLPAVIQREQEAFQKFYQDKHRGRVVHWKNSLAHCIVKAFLPKGKWDLDVSLFQTVVLLQFNHGRKSLTFAQLQDLTLLPPDELSRTVQSLAFGRKEFRILVRAVKGTQPAVPVVAAAGGGHEDEGEDEDDGPQRSASRNEGGDAAASKEKKEPTTIKPHLDDVYQVNVQWSSKRSRLKINQIQLRETRKENEDTHQRVAYDRQHNIDATIVRIMKARKKLSHNLLLTELFKQLQFPAKPQDLKKRIESLIERDYLERNEENADEYLYVA